jgi:hypothetical protein
MTTPLGRSNTPSLLRLNPTNRHQTFCILFPTPKGIAQRTYLIDPSTIAFPTATDRGDYHAQPSIMAFPTSTDISDGEEIRTSTTDAASGLLSTCGGPTHALSLSQPDNR